MDVTIDNRQVLHEVEKRLSRLRNPRPLLREIGRYIRAQTMMMLRDRRPDNAAVRGESWPKLAESTVNAKRAAYKRGAAAEPVRPLVFTGRLRASLEDDAAIKIRGKGLEYGTRVTSDKGFPYPGLHQVGDGHVPQRRWLFLNDTDVRQIMQMAVDWIDSYLAKIGIAEGRVSATKARISKAEGRMSRARTKKGYERAQKTIERARKRLAGQEERVRKAKARKRKYVG